MSESVGESVSNSVDESVCACVRACVREGGSQSVLLQLVGTAYVAHAVCTYLTVI